MAFRYVLEPNSGDSHQVAPYWLALVVPFFHRVTVDRAKLLQNSQYQQDISRDDVDSMREGPKILLEHEVLQWQTSQSKENPRGTLNLSLANTGVDWRSKIVGGDWILFWTFENRDDYLRIRNKLRTVKGKTEVLAAEGESNGDGTPGSNACNGFHDGLKFVGRINSVRRYRRRDGNSGVKTSQYAITALSFREVSYGIHFNPSFTGAYSGNQLQFQIDFAGFNEFVLASSESGAIPAGKALASLISVCLGFGAGKQWKPFVKGPKPGEVIAATPTGGVRIAVPETVGVCLKGDKNGVGYNFYDIMEKLVGIQRYPTQGQASRRYASTTDPSLGMAPELPADNFLEGAFRAQLLDYNNTTIWNVLRTYLLPPINEMYTTLRVGKDGYVRPTIVARQVPFSSRLFDNTNSPTEGIGSNQTSFLDVPRWVVSPALVESEDLGTSDGLRYNYVHLPPHDISLASQSQLLQQNSMYVLAPPVVDKKDIERNGLSMYTQTLTSASALVNYDKAKDAHGGYWTQVMSDFITTQHLRHSGTLRLVGVQEPICVGDNLEYDGGLYHIEQVTHSGGIQGMGMRTFNTELMVTNGISLASDGFGNQDNVYMVEDNGAGSSGGQRSGGTASVIPELEGLRDVPVKAAGATSHSEPKDKAPEGSDAVGMRVFDGLTVDRSDE
jgi:hypothetical protein